MVGTKKHCLLTDAADGELREAIAAELDSEAHNVSEIARVSDLDTDSVAKILDRKSVSHITLKRMMEGFGLELTESSYGKVKPPRQASSTNPLEQLQPMGMSESSQDYPNNPFWRTLPIGDPDGFLGREHWFSSLLHELNKGCSLNLVGPERIGRSSILKQVCAVGKTRIPRSVDQFAYLNLREVDDAQDFFEALCHELAIDPPRTGYALSRALKGKQRIICLDDIEQWTDAQRFDRSERRQLRGLIDAGTLIVVIASKTCLSELFPDSSVDASNLYGICRRMEVPPFSQQDVKEWLDWHLRPLGVSFGPQQIQSLWEKSGGVPGVLQQLATELYDSRGFGMLG